MSGRPDPSVQGWTGVAGERGPGGPATSPAPSPRGPANGPGRGAGPASSPDRQGQSADRSAQPHAGAPAEPGVPAPDDAPGAGTSAAPQSPILTDVAALEAERDEYLGALQRLKADFDNYRKRVVRQQEEQAARAAGDLVTKLLPVLDNLDLAWAHLGDGNGAEGATSEEARALSQSRSQLIDVLAREGLERVDAAEVLFDPTVHDAVAHSPATHSESDGTATGDAEATPGDENASGAGGVRVDEVMRAGYRWRGQVLRPAMVRVRG